MKRDKGIFLWGAVKQLIRIRKSLAMCQAFFILQSPCFSSKDTSKWKSGKTSCDHGLLWGNHGIIGYNHGKNMLHHGKNQSPLKCVLLKKTPPAQTLHKKRQLP
ncbi:hypothetical protein AWM68_16450 [Fictibacillus phosphorivorans]|uniref:Uncharacterized protein n=1 Tax=Fictibacillus phosphorivorans TaxID=1221500 RepID=A0A165P0Q1_9BACL|nr:hypothetical protein AWM68_16450 [Fictibacillus phosphorivorans]